jgi:hypothetical protein
MDLVKRRRLVWRFWVGLLELAAHASDSRRFNEAADDFAARLAPRVTSPTVLRGFLYWYGAALARRPDTAREAAALLAADFDSVGRLTMSWLGRVSGVVWVAALG